MQLTSTSKPSEGEERERAKVALSDALAVAVELIGAPPPTPEGAQALLSALLAYPLDAALRAIARCGRELRTRLSLADILERLDDGRPTAEEAWAQVGTADEGVTMVTTDEAMQALGTVEHLLAGRDMVAARMSFKDAYARIVRESREAGVPVRPHVSLGRDRPGQVRALTQAVQAGRLDADHAAQLLGVSPEMLLGHAQPRLAARAPVAALASALARSKGPEPCQQEPTCNGWTHGENGPRCPQWGGATTKGETT